MRTVEYFRAVLLEKRESGAVPELLPPLAVHEVGIAASILAIAEEAARGRSIRAVGLRLGSLTGVVREALEFAFEALKPGTTLIIEPVLLSCSCDSCAWTGAPAAELCFQCPTCGNPVHIVAGREMQVVYVDLETPGGAVDGTDHAATQSSPQER